MRNIRSILAPVIAAALLAGLTMSCQSKIADEDTLELKLYRPDVSGVASRQFVDIDASCEWTLSIRYRGDADGWATISHDEDITLSDTTASGPASLVLAWGHNGTESRALDLVLSGAGMTRTVTMTQQGRVVAPPSATVVESATPAEWLELPATDNEDLDFVTHFMTGNGEPFRNYSYYYDRRALIAVWVAYPLNNKLIGSGDRSNAWGLDPKMPSLYQPVLYSGFKGGYDRGHQLPSADRLASGANEATFYGTNMTPQLASLNQHGWAALEGLVRDWSKKSDTLYVVTGADLNGSRDFAIDNNGKQVAVPVGYYKALLMRKGYSWRGIGFYFRHEGSNAKTRAELLRYSMSIDALEEKTGFDFFVNLPSQIGEERAAEIEASPGDWWQNN